jgi:hypothetical protein
VYKYRILKIYSWPFLKLAYISCMGGMHCDIYMCAYNVS